MSGIRKATLSIIVLSLCSCGRQNPSGSFCWGDQGLGSEVFQAKVIMGSESCELLLILKQSELRRAIMPK